MSQGNGKLIEKEPLMLPYIFTMDGQPLWTMESTEPRAEMLKALRAQFVLPDGHDYDVIAFTAATKEQLERMVTMNNLAAQMFNINQVMTKARAAKSGLVLADGGQPH